MDNFIIVNNFGMEAKDAIGNICLTKEICNLIKENASELILVPVIEIKDNEKRIICFSLTRRPCEDDM